MKRGGGHANAITMDAAGRLQLELRWLSVVESVDNEINTVAIANSQTNDNLQVRKSRDCATCDIGLYAGPDAEYQLNTLSDDDDAIDAIPLSLLCSQEAFFSV